MQEEIRPPRPEERAAFLAIAAEYLPGIPPARVADMPLQLCLARGEALIGVAYAEPRTRDELCLQGIAVVPPTTRRAGAARCCAPWKGRRGGAGTRRSPWARRTATSSGFTGKTAMCRWS